MQNRMYYSEDAKRRARRERGLIAGLFLGLGLSIGTIIALLFAPETGEEIRGHLASSAETLRDNMEDRVKKIS